MDICANDKISTREMASLFADPHWAARFPPLLTPDQAAELLQVPKQTVYDWSSRGLLAGCKAKVGKHLRLMRDRLIRKIFEEGINGQP
jgi:excisionase family DNA binding protein